MTELNQDDNIDIEESLDHFIYEQTEVDCLDNEEILNNYDVEICDESALNAINPTNHIEDHKKSNKMHAVLQLQDIHGANVYCCLQCNMNYASLAEFAAKHEEAAVAADLMEDNTIAANWNIQRLDETADFIDDMFVAEEVIQEEQINANDIIIYNDDDDDDANDDVYVSEAEQQQLEEFPDCTNEVPNVIDELENLVDETIEEDEHKYFCYDCHTVFGNLATAEQHVCNITRPKIKEERPKRTRKMNATPVTCELCNTVFNSAKNLKFHMRIHDKRAVKTIQDALPTAAQKQYNELNQFYCEICNKSFDQNLLTVHKNMHQNVEEHICGICNRRFENMPSYEMHMKLHEQKKNALRINNNQNVNTKHTQVQGTSSSSGKNTYPCQYCGRAFGRPYEKVKHERIHTGEKPYECEVCGKTFRVAYSLTLHLRTHTNIRPYVCGTCNKRFKSQQVYAHHLRTHSDVMLYKCDICAKSFRTSVQLYAHKNSHNKPFNCTVCNRPFASLYAVKSHMKIHNRYLHNTTDGDNKGNATHKLNEPQLRCSICGAAYARLYALRSHMLNSHGVSYDKVVNAGETVEQQDEAAILIAAAESSRQTYMTHNLNENVIDVGNQVVEEIILQQDAFSNEVVVADDWLTK